MDLGYLKCYGYVESAQGNAVVYKNPTHQSVEAREELTVNQLTRSTMKFILCLILLALMAMARAKSEVEEPEPPSEEVEDKRLLSHSVCKWFDSPLNKNRACVAYCVLHGYWTGRCDVWHVCHCVPRYVK